MKLKFSPLAFLGLTVCLSSVSPVMAQPTTFIRTGIETGANVTTINTNAVRQVTIINVNGLVPYPNSVISTPINNLGNNFGNNLGISSDRFTSTIPIVQTNTIINRTVIHPNTYTNTTTTVGGFVTNGYDRLNPVEQTNIYNSNYGNGFIQNPIPQNPSVTIINVIPSNNSNGFCVNGICTSNSIPDTSRRSLILLNDYNRYGSSYRIR